MSTTAACPDARSCVLRGQVPRWIPVAERLPSGDNQVLVVVSGKPKENITLAGAVELATLYSDGWCLETWPEWTGADVTHWMPLPEEGGR